MEGLQVEYRDVSALAPYERNARTHSPEQVSLLAKSITEFGFTNPILVDANGGVIAGHGRLLAARELGMSSVPVIALAHLSEAQRRAYVIADNRLAEDAGWDDDMLRLELGFLAEMEVDLGLTGFSGRELDQLTSALRGSGLTDEDAVPAPPTVPTTALGDLWVLGEHRLLCGDSTSVEAVTRLMDGQRAVLFATDPPYLVNYDGTNHPGKNATRNKDWGDSYHEQGWDDAKQGQAFYLAFVQAAIAAAITEHAAWYCWHASRRQAMLEEVWVQCGAFVHQQIVWAKSRGVLTHSVYLWAHEPCLMGWAKGNKPKVNRTGIDQYPRSVWDMDALEQYGLTLWDIKSSEVESTAHPTSKPVRVFTIPMQLHTDPGDICYEPFSGSGSQLIAAQKTGRRCYGLELSPIYCDVILKRWQDFTGGRAVLEGDGGTFEEIEARRRT